MGEVRLKLANRPHERASPLSGRGGDRAELGRGGRARANFAFARVLLQDPLWDTGPTVFELSGGERNSNIRTEMSVCDAEADVVSTFFYDVFLTFLTSFFPILDALSCVEINAIIMLHDDLGRRHRRRHSKWLSASSCNAGVLWLALDQT